MKDVAEVRDLVRASKTVMDEKYGAWMVRWSLAFQGGSHRYFKAKDSKKA